MKLPNIDSSLKKLETRFHQLLDIPIYFAKKNCTKPSKTKIAMHNTIDL